MKNINVDLGGSTFTLLGLLFITLKLFGKIDWCWGWVLAPFWIPFALFLVVLIGAGLVWLVATALDAWVSR